MNDSRDKMERKVLLPTRHHSLMEKIEAVDKEVRALQELLKQLAADEGPRGHYKCKWALLAGRAL